MVVVVKGSVGEVWFEIDSNLVPGFGLLKFLKRFQIRFKPQTVCTYNFFL